MKQHLCTLLFILLLLLPGDGQRPVLAAEESPKKLPEELLIVLVPETNVFQQRKQYKYVTDYLSRKLHMTVLVEIMSSYGKICDAFLEGRADAGFFGSFSYVLTRAKAEIEPIARPEWLDGSSMYSGYLFVRIDSTSLITRLMSRSVPATISVLPYR